MMCAAKFKGATLNEDELFDDETGEFVERKLHSTRVQVRRRVTADVGRSSRTRQEFAAECDINTIMKRYKSTGVVSHVNPRAPQYLDLGAAPDFHSAMNLMIAASDAFMSLPSEVRRDMHNDPQEFVSFAADPKNIDQMRKWGLAPPAEKPPQAPAPAAPAAGATPPPTGGGDPPKSS